MKTLDILRFPPKIHLLTNAVGELTYDVCERLNVMVRKQDVEPEQQSESDVQIERHEVFYAWA